MSKSGSKTVGITMGDPEGIGPEVIRAALKSPRIARLAKFVCIGNKRLFKGLPAQTVDISYKTAGEGALKALEHAVALVKDGAIDALVTAPLSKERVNRYQKDFIGHTEYLAQAFAVKNFDMMFIGPRVRLSLLTRHVPVKDVPGLVRKKAIVSCIELMHETLAARFKIRRPRIAVLGLNPHAGEGGLLGTEDKREIVPAIAAVQKKGIQAQGPFAADTFFYKDRGFDGVVAMYHDQGLAPVKALHFKNLVNYTAGLPFVRTSPVHGTAFDIAGRGLADASSMMAAIKLACRLAS